jgi:hypothetical protein
MLEALAKTFRVTFVPANSASWIRKMLALQQLRQKIMSGGTSYEKPTLQ